MLSPGSRTVHSTTAHTFSRFVQYGSRSAAVVTVIVASISESATGQRSITPTSTVPVLTAPQGLAVTATPNGPQLTWQKSGAAAGYQVLRAPNVSSPASIVAALPATVLSYLDRGFNAAAVYQVVAVGADKRTAASASVSYAPPVVNAPVTRMLPATPVVPSPTITSIANSSLGSILTLGDTIPVRGSNFGTITRVSFVTGCYIGPSPFTTCHGRPCGSVTACHPDPYGVGATATILAPSATGFSFVLPSAVPVNVNSDVSSSSNSSGAGVTLLDTYFLVVQFDAGRADTSWGLKFRTRP